MEKQKGFEMVYLVGDRSVVKGIAQMLKQEKVCYGVSCS